MTLVTGTLRLANGDVAANCKAVFRWIGGPATDDIELIIPTDEIVDTDLTGVISITLEPGNWSLTIRNNHNTWTEAVAIGVPDLVSVDIETLIDDATPAFATNRVREYATLEAFENDVAAGFTIQDGLTVRAAGEDFMRETGATGIPTLQGWSRLVIGPLHGGTGVANTGNETLVTTHGTQSVFNKTMVAAVMTGAAVFGGLNSVGINSLRETANSGNIFASRAEAAIGITGDAKKITVISPDGVKTDYTYDPNGIALITDYGDKSWTPATDYLSPGMYGVYGISPVDGVVPTVDESQGYHNMFMDYQRLMRPIWIPARRYLIDTISMPMLTVCANISGDRASRIYAGENYRGPVIWIDGQLMAASLLPDTNSAIKISNINLVASRKDSLGNLIPAGTQHGFVITGRNERIIFEDTTADGFRGWGTAIGHGGSTAVAYLGEANWRGHRVENCGVGTLFAAWEFMVFQTGSRTNNVFFDSCFCNFGPSVSMRFRTPRRSVGVNSVYFKNLQMHGQGVLVETEGFDPTDTAILEVDGAVDNFCMTGLAAASNEVGQYAIAFRNSNLDFVTLAADAVTTTNGSTTLQITLPALPSSDLVTAQVQTLEGSPLIGFTWPNVSDRPVVGDYLSVGVYSGGARVTFQAVINGLTIDQTDMMVWDVDSNGIVWCKAMRGFATSTGVSATSVNRVLKKTYGLGVGNTGVSFDERANGGVIASSLVVNGVRLTGFRKIASLTDFNVFTAVFTDAALSSGVSAFSPVPVLRIDSAIVPRDVRVEGRITGEGKGVLVDGGGVYDFNIGMPMPGAVVYKITSNINGPVVIGARGTESTFVTDIDPLIAGLVSNVAGGTSRSFPIRGDAFTVSNGANNQINNKSHRRSIAGATAGRLTENGFAASATNVWGVVREGTFSYIATVVARQSSGTLGTKGDIAKWSFNIDADYDGTNFTIKAVNNVAYTVPVSLAPNFSDAAASAWRVEIEPDNTLKAPIINGKGETSKTIDWLCSIQRLDIFQGGEVTPTEEPEPEEE